MSRVLELEQLARDMVGDGKRPNIFFVTCRGAVELITQDWDTAYAFWLSMGGVVSDLEDRLTGVVCSREQQGGGRLVVYDDSTMRMR